MSHNSGNRYECIFADIRITMLWEEHIVKLLGVHIGKNLTFTNHVKHFGTLQVER